MKEGMNGWMDGWMAGMEMKWNEMKWNEMKCNEMTWHDMTRHDMNDRRNEGMDDWMIRMNEWTTDMKLNGWN